MSEVMIRQYANVAGLALLVYDQLLTWEQEVQCIWIGSERFIKLSFFLSRYLALVIQIVNTIYSSPFVLRKRGGDCLPWYAFQTFGDTVLLWNMEAVMMVRIYALYDRARLVGAFLIIWFLCARTLDLWSGTRSMIQIELDLSCVPKRTPDSTKWFSCAVIFNQSLLWILTYQKYRNAVKEGWSKHPIIRVVMRDNTWACMTIIVLLISLLPYTFFIQQLGHVIFCILCCTISIMTCRLILNMRAIKNTGNSDSRVELTTVLTIAEEGSYPSGGQ